MTSRPSDPILRRMIRANDEYWDSDRASYEDELEAWRERIAVATTVEAPKSRVEARRSTRRPARPRIWPNLRPRNVSGDRRRLSKLFGTRQTPGHAQAARRDRSELSRATWLVCNAITQPCAVELGRPSGAFG